MSAIKGPGIEAEHEVVSADKKLELLGYDANLVFKDGENTDIDLLNENRSLIHTGKFLRRPESGFEWNGWTEIFVLLFDNYLVMTKPKEEDGVTKYQVNQRPISLDLLTLRSFVDPPIQRGRGLLSFGNDVQKVYPCTIHHYGRSGGLYTLFTESAEGRVEWQAKLEEAIEVRRSFQESNKAFEVKTLDMNTSFAPMRMTNARASCDSDKGSFTGKITCSVPFNTPDGRSLVAIGCAEGVWIGFRHDSQFVRVLSLRMVTQCAILESFGFFLVLADKVLYAYHIETLVPSSPKAASVSHTPLKLSRSNNVEFFTSGNIEGRTLVIYMKKKNFDSVFVVLEPVMEEMNEKTVAQSPIEGSMSMDGLRSLRQERFRVYREFFSPCDAYDLLFMRTRVLILCNKGFEILDLSEFKSVTIPQRDDPVLKKLAKRIKSCRPINMVKLNEDEFLLCYNEFGLYVDKHGDPSRADTVGWEGTADRVVWYPPHILLFNSQFIEIRHANTGHLVQIISGNKIRCIWDGRDINHFQPASEGSGGKNKASRELRVYGVMDTEASQPGNRTQRVFELIPRVSVHLPGSSLPPHS